MFRWRPVKEMKAGMIRNGVKDEVGANAWDQATDYMKRGYLPPLLLVTRLASQKPPVFTRRHRWVVAGALETLTHCVQEETALHRRLKQMRMEAQRGVETES